MGQSEGLIISNTAVKNQYSDMFYSARERSRGCETESSENDETLLHKCDSFFVQRAEEDYGAAFSFNLKYSRCVTSDTFIKIKTLASVVCIKACGILRPSV